MPRPAAHSSVFKWLSRCERLNDGLPTDSVHFGSFTAKFVHITTFSFVEMRPPGGAARVHRAALQPAALQPVCTVHRTRVTTNLGLWERNAIYGRNANVWRLGRCDWIHRGAVGGGHDFALRAQPATAMSTTAPPFASGRCRS